MEPKKNAKADLTKKSFLFFNLGLIITLTLIVTAFSYKVYDDTSRTDLDKSTLVTEDIPDVPVTEHLPPPPRIEIRQIIEIEDTDKPEDQIEAIIDTETTMTETIAEIPVAEIEVPTEDPNIIWSGVIEENAAPVGGLSTFYGYVQKQIKYPPQARRMNIEGRVFVEFVIEKDGSITDVKWIKGIGAGCDEEAVRVVQSAPKWKPGKQRGKPVRQRMVIPIVFKLG